MMKDEFSTKKNQELIKYKQEVAHACRNFIAHETGFRASVKF